MSETYGYLRLCYLISSTPYLRRLWEVQHPITVPGAHTQDHVVQFFRNITELERLVLLEGSLYEWTVNQL